MICQFCAAEDAQSTLTPDSYGTATLMGFSCGHYDPAGTWVPGRDPNWYTLGYQCSRGHYFTVREREGDPPQVTLISALSTTPQPPEDHTA